MINPVCYWDKMDKEVAETLAYFRENAADLKALGKEWGLNDEEIAECIKRAMSVDRKDLPAPETTASPTTRLKFAVRKRWSLLRVLLAVTVVLGLFIGISAIALDDDHFQHRLDQLVQPILYPLLRSVRLIASPFHDIFDMYDWVLTDCFISNPLFDPDTILGDHICEVCENVNSVTEFTAESLGAGPIPSSAFNEPVLVKGRGINVTFERFQQILSKNLFSRQKMLGVKTNLSWAPQVKDLLAEDAAEKLARKPDFYFFWTSKEVTISQLMRKIFPRSDVVEPSSEVSIMKHIFLTGPKANKFPLERNMRSTFSWYFQGSGSTRVEMVPVKRCQQQCAPITTILVEGDILIFNGDLYHTEVKPLGDDINISFLGYIYPAEF